MRIALIILCLLLTGWVAPISLESTPSPVHAPVYTDAPSPVTPPKESDPSFSGMIWLPEPISTMGDLTILYDEDLSKLPAKEIAEKYGAEYATYDNLYEVPDFSIGGYQARLFIQVKDEAVLQLVASQVVPNSELLPAVYKQLTSLLGAPEGIYQLDGYNEISGTVDEDQIFGKPEHVQAIWNVDGQNLALGVTYGYQDAFSNHHAWYLAAYKDRLDFRQISWHLSQDESLRIPSGTNTDPIALFTDPVIFSSPAQELILKTGARRAYRGWDGSTYEPSYYVITDYTFYGLPGDVSLYGDPINMVVYNISLGDLSEEEAMPIYSAIHRDIESSIWGGNRYADPIRTAPQEDEFGQTVIDSEWGAELFFDQIVLSYVQRDSQWWHNQFIPAANVISLRARHNDPQ